MTVLDTVKVLHLLPPGFGGIDTYVFNHYRHMNRVQFQFDCITRNRALESAEQYSDLSYKVHILPVTAAEDRTAFVQCIQEVLFKGYDVLHLHTPFWTGFLIEEMAKAANIKKVIVHAHGMSIEGSSSEERCERLNRHNVLKKAFRPELATDFWACSQPAADWLFGEQIPRERIVIMKNAIDVSKYKFDIEKRGIFRERLDLKDSFVLGTVGRLTDVKNQAFLIELLYEFKKNHPNTKLLIIGDGELRKELEAQVQKSALEDAVLFLGWKNNVEDYLQAMDVFLLPSKFEGVPMVVLEAAAAGLPCVVSENVTNEIVCSPNIQRRPLNLETWVSDLGKLLKSPADRLTGSNFLRTAGYDVVQQAKVLERMYEA